MFPYINVEHDNVAFAKIQTFNNLMHENLNYSSRLLNSKHNKLPLYTAINEVLILINFSNYKFFFVNFVKMMIYDI
jgi:hypothetical protein